MVVGGTALFGGGRGGAAQSKAVVEFRAGKMTTQAGKHFFPMCLVILSFRYKISHLSNE